MLKGRNIRIAVIDDDQDDFLIISDYINEIEGPHIQIDWYSTYEEGLQQIMARSYHIYFVDYRLGRRTGLELLQEAIALGCQEPLVLLTGKGNKLIDIQAMETGATDYLVKSDLNKEKLERCIRYSLDRTAFLKELKARENKYRNLFENSKDAVFIMNPTLVFTEVNDAASELFGTDRADLVSSSLYDLIDDKNQRDQIKTMLEGNQLINDLEVKINVSDHETRSCLLSIVVQEAAEHEPLLHGILHDITNIKKAELANLQAQKLAANERLVRMLAHEIRNPLNNISLSVEHMGLLEKNEKQSNLLAIVQKNSVRINQIITELLNLTRPADLVFQKHSLQDILEESLAEAIDRIKLQKVRVKKVYPDHPLEIMADKPKLCIAITNILINGIEAMESEKGELSVVLNNSGDSFNISIQDNGCGIPEEYLSKLFEPFFTMKKNGMGLGLAASFFIIQSHKGTIQVESAVNKGTNFIIRFKKESEVVD